MKRLLREGANVWDADSHGWTALHWACSRGSAVMTTILLQAVGEMLSIVHVITCLSWIYILN